MLFWGRTWTAGWTVGEMGATCHWRLDLLCSGSNKRGCCLKHFNYLRWGSPSIPPARRWALKSWTTTNTTVITEANLTLVTKFVSSHVSGGGGEGAVTVRALRRSGSPNHLPAITQFEMTEGIAPKSAALQYLPLFKTLYSGLSLGKDKGHLSPNCLAASPSPSPRLQGRKFCYRIHSSFPSHLWYKIAKTYQ
jgi:hypothetical protein